MSIQLVLLLLLSLSDSSASPARVVRLKLRRVSWRPPATRLSSSWQHPVTPPATDAESLHNFRDVQYYGLVGYGTPQQWFTVLVDTGSPVTWLPTGSWCASNGGCAGHNGFTPAASSTCVALPSTVNVAYGDGSSVQGAYVSDVMTLAGLEVQDVSVSLVSAGSAPSDGVFDGLLGLGLASGGMPLNVAQQAVQRGLLPAPVFSFWLNPDPLQPENGGEFALGGLAVQAGAPLVWVNVSSRELGGWPVPMSGVWVGGEKLGCVHGCVAGIDTGTSLIMGPPDEVSAIYGAINAALRAAGGARGNCALAALRMPLLSFGLGGSMLVLRPDQYLRRTQCGVLTCEASLAPIASANFTAGSPTWLLGDAFLGAYATTFDCRSGSVGFSVALRPPAVTQRQLWLVSNILIRVGTVSLALTFAYLLTIRFSKPGGKRISEQIVIEMPNRSLAVP